MKSVKILFFGLLVFAAFYLGTLTGQGNSDANGPDSAINGSGGGHGGGRGGRGGRGGMRRGIMGSLGGGKKKKNSSPGVADKKGNSEKKSLKSLSGEADSGSGNDNSSDSENSSEGVASAATGNGSGDGTGSGSRSDSGSENGAGGGANGAGVGANGAGSDEDTARVSVRVSSMVERDMESTIQVSGTVLPVSEVQVRAKASGVLEQILVQEGDRVEPDQVLAVIESQRQEHAVARSKILVEEAELNLQRIKLPPRDEEVKLRKLRVDQAGIRKKQSLDKLQTNRELFKENLLIKNTLESTESDFDYLNSAYETARQELEVFMLPPLVQDVKSRELTLKQRKLDQQEAELALDERKPKSPIAGLLIRRMVEPFELVTMNQHLFSVADIRRFRIEAKVPYGDAMIMDVGDGCRIEVESPQGFVGCSGVVERIAPSVDAATGTVDAELVFTEPPLALRPGLFAKATVVTDIRENVPCLPRTALILTAGGNSSFSSGKSLSSEVSAVARGKGGRGVFVLSGEAGVAFVEVLTGFQDETWVEILGGLSPEASVVVAGQNLLDERSRVKVLTAEVTSRVRPLKSGNKRGGGWH
ncbi:MAG: hypothetical protein CVV64_19500 [Candidatus Wallbacteria bacterium HGW-Wallbacteria-1]|jgi:multidrug efflux pump subunit AcrA (membrane-fusion protein)|uniref:Uncharacterized protein n=1 Tax=Candidatus Wallbacteria bacterium HGW-Wallbacteria-1 TaxID=2013854 RepID=A0A2N1PIW0_9BACT|nr:MAG: hypothetical protein CVV64_19500 [Candidatus Wallbacteria bacterium HGW-Wallbacteria-1]